MRWRTPIHMPGLHLESHEQMVAITTPFGQKLVGRCRYGEWELPAEAILGFAGIHNPVARARCIKDLERMGVAHPGLPDVLHGGKRPTVMALPSTQGSIHVDCTTARFDMIMEDLRLMDCEPTTRYENFIACSNDLLALTRTFGRLRSSPR